MSGPGVRALFWEDIAWLRSLHTTQPNRRLGGVTFPEARAMILICQSFGVSQRQIARAWKRSVWMIARHEAKARRRLRYHHAGIQAAIRVV